MDFKRLCLAVTCVCLISILVGCDFLSSSPPLITQQPVSQRVTQGQAATFTVSASGYQLAYQWMKNGAVIPDANAPSYTATAPFVAGNGTQFQVSISNRSGSVLSIAAILSVIVAPDVTTFHNDNMRTGQNLDETFLTPQNVNVATFGKIAFLSVDGKVDAQPLFLAGVQIPGTGSHNIVYAATEHDSVYAFDETNQSVLWQISLVGAGETSSDARGCFAVTPEIGVTATPVIDRSSGPNGAICLVSATEDSSGNYHQRLHALDITNGSELFGGPTEIAAQFPGAGANSDGVNVIFDPAQYVERPALLLSNGLIYLSWASHCDSVPYTGWVMAYNENSLQQTGVLNLTPNGSQGAIWMAGAGPAADREGNVYLLDANGTFDVALDANEFPASGDFGNAFVKLAPGATSVADYFATYNTIIRSDADGDLGSGGVTLLPDLPDATGVSRHLAVGAGKDGNIYVVDRDNMGRYNASINDIYQEIPEGPGALNTGVTSTPAYFGSTVYYGADGDNLRAFPVSNALLSPTTGMKSAFVFPYPGTTPSISANGEASAILWAAENGTTGALHAYDATNLGNELYDSNQAGARDQFGAGNKFVVPTVANGRVYLGTTNGVVIFGLLSGSNNSASARRAR